MAHSMFNPTYLAALILAGKHGDGGKFRYLHMSVQKETLTMLSSRFIFLIKSGLRLSQVGVLGFFERYSVCLY
ncbi:MAG: hypothetical protein COA84_12135 [Robiginitomaculum sp.]|nr:MAG: hypothetical protein COA84_12135 [Robiginitomaculum sp.]